MVYKINPTYYDKVPVILSEDKNKIVSYPHPKDLKSGEELLLPDLLEDGYFLDHKGIQKNTAFLSYTYEEYSKLSGPPSLQELMRKILDKDPFTELCDCGSRKGFDDIKSQVNQLIRQKSLRKVCKIIK
jgi:hypothetical protein